MSRAGRIVVGIDPGLAACGLAVVKERDRTYESLHVSCTVTSPKTAFPDRLSLLYDATRAVVRRFRPDSVALERLFFAKNATTAIAVGQAQGAILLALAGTGLDPAWYSPVAVKSAVTGDGAADKDAVGKMIARLLGLKEVPKPDDAADALAVAYCHLVSTRPGLARPRG